MRSTATVELTGPFFTVDVDKTLFENVHKMMEGIAEEASRAEREGYLTGAGQRDLIRETGDRVADHVEGRVVSESGKEWAATAVAGVTNIGYSARESRSILAAASYVESRTRAVGRTTRQIRSAKSVLQADLAKGLA